jgi:hypothetical protein
MNKKLFGILTITIFILGISLAQPVIAEAEEENLKFQGIGFIRIDSSNYEIKGFVIVGNNAGEILFFKPINIKYDGTPILVTHPLPFLFTVKYKLAK